MKVRRKILCQRCWSAQEDEEDGGGGGVVMQLSSVLVPLPFSRDKLAARLELAAACPACPATLSLCRVTCRAGALLPHGPCLPGQFCSLGEVWWRDAELVRSCLTSHFLGSANYQIEFHWNTLAEEVFFWTVPMAPQAYSLAPHLRSFFFFFLPFQSEVFCFSRWLFISALNVFKW